jgi:hypothetical protein
MEIRWGERTYLRTLCIELRRLCLMQRQQLMANKIVSRRQGRGNRAFPVQVLEDFGCAPVLAG